MRGLDRFEGRSSFKTWLFRILLNRAGSGIAREMRAGRPTRALSSTSTAMARRAEPPVPWTDRVDDRLVAERLAHRVQELLPELPDQQRQVLILRDVEGLDPESVASLLGISDGDPTRPTASRRQVAGTAGRRDG